MLPAASKPTPIGLLKRRSPNAPRRSANTPPALAQSADLMPIARIENQDLLIRPVVGDPNAPLPVQTKPARIGIRPERDARRARLSIGIE